MPYQLILSEPTIEGKCSRKDVGKNVFLDNLPSGYPVYLFYYPGAMPNQDLESKLRDLGDITGDNLFVNIGRLNDSRYQEIVSMFSIKDLPVIILTAIDKLASPSTKFLTMYARIDDKKLMESPDLVLQCSQTIYNLLIQGKIAEAMRHAKQTKRRALISRLKKTVLNALKEIWEFVKDVDISVSLIEGRFELKHNER
jgi:hypothetical protein